MARPVVLKVVPIMGAAFSGITMNQFVCASLFPHPLLLNTTGTEDRGHRYREFGIDLLCRKE